MPEGREKGGYEESRETKSLRVSSIVSQYSCALYCFFILCSAVHRSPSLTIVCATT